MSTSYGLVLEGAGPWSITTAKEGATRTWRGLLPCYRSAMARQEGTMQFRFAAVLMGVLAMPLVAQAQTFPGADWQRKTPAEAGINPQLLKDAIDFAVASEIKNPR